MFEFKVATSLMTRRKIFIVAKFEMKTTWKLDDSPVPGMQNANEKNT
jgi:hypothetical protein